VHVFNCLVVFRDTAYDPIEIARLPNRPFGATGSIDAERRRHFESVHKVRQAVACAGDDERVPVVRHEDVAREKESPAGTNPPHSTSQRFEVGLGQLRSNAQQIAGNEEGPSGHLESAQTGHDVIVAQGLNFNPAAFRVRTANPAAFAFPSVQNLPKTNTKDLEKPQGLRGEPCATLAVAGTNYTLTNTKGRLSHTSAGNGAALTLSRCQKPRVPA
jgi:hypothetical protein